MELGNLTIFRGFIVAAILSGLNFDQISAWGQDRFIRQPSRPAAGTSARPLVSIVEINVETNSSEAQSALKKQGSTASDGSRQLVSIVETSPPPSTHALASPSLASSVPTTNATSSVLELIPPIPEDSLRSKSSTTLNATALPLDARSSRKDRASANNYVPASQFVWKPRGSATSDTTGSRAVATPFAVVSQRQEFDDPQPRKQVPVPAANPTDVAPLHEPIAPVAQASPAAQTAQAVHDQERTNYRAMATEISRELVEQFEAQQPTGQQTLSLLEAPPGWQAVGEQLSLHINRCDELISRKAYLSATEEAIVAIHHLLRVLDLHSSQYQCEPLWAEAQQVLREAEDFADAQRLASEKQLLERLIASHETQILKHADVSQLSPLAAAQFYHRHAQERLVTASQGHPWASELYYTLGRSLQAMSDSGDPRAEIIRWRALTYYRSARDVSPTNAVAANQLGFLLLKMDRASEARDVLIQSVQNGGPVAAWQNLVEASRRLGDTSVQEWATRNYLAVRQQMGQEPTAGVQLVEVNAQQFAAMSPYGSGPRPTLPSTNAVPAPTNYPPQIPDARTAQSSWTSPTFR